MIDEIVKTIVSGLSVGLGTGAAIKVFFVAYRSVRVMTGMPELY